MYRRVFVTVGLGLALLAGCGPLNPGTITTGVSNANLRVLNGMPGQTVSATLDTSTGSAMATSLAYEKIAPYISISAVNHSLVVSAAGLTTPLTCPVGILTPGYNYTVVVAGTVGSSSSNTGPQCQVFLEPPYAGTTTTGNFQIHNASPAAGANGDSILSIGTYPVGTTTYSTAIGSSPAFNANPTSAITTYSTVLTLNSSTTGIGFWVSPQNNAPTAGSKTTATFLPSTGIAASSSATVTDATNLFPTSNLVNLSIYAVDAPVGSATLYNLVGVFEGI